MTIKNIIITAIALSFSNFLHAQKPSVLLINVDDWNDWNTVLKGHPQAITPNLNRFAEQSVTFSNAICASPSCIPSRPAFFTGMAPSRTGNISNDNGKHPWRFYAGSWGSFHTDAIFAKRLEKYRYRQNFHRGDDAEFDHYIPPFKTPKKLKNVGIKLNSSAIWDIADIPTSKWQTSRPLVRALKLSVTLGVCFIIDWYLSPSRTVDCSTKYFDYYPIESLQLQKQIDNDLDDLPERLKLVVVLKQNLEKITITCQEWLRQRIY